MISLLVIPLRHFENVRGAKRHTEPASFAAIRVYKHEAPYLPLLRDGTGAGRLIVLHSPCSMGRVQ